MTAPLFPGAGRRLKVMVMASEALLGFLRGMDGRAAYRLYGMPEDTKCVGVTTSRDGEAKVVFLLESKEFPELAANDAEIPELKCEVLTAIMPNRLEPPPAMVKKLKTEQPSQSQITTKRFRKLE